MRSSRQNRALSIAVTTIAMNKMGQACEGRQRVANHLGRPALQ